ncbi:MAG: RIP metalloprotease RseP [Candidatus Koribacter versatilis]|uniref:Zinc metalloprotease n=1 Tax=Candidatus Korobacter versatilis TaxID=658062 RepID=A0A932A8F5_9BACT|nr:RIP metalloprotease RseP [Candidatus Koribacter versatilis]
MSFVLLAVVSFIVVLGALVLIHEFGHFAAAKYFGVRVETFSIGFGKRLLGFKRGDTDYRLSALPLGGYVKMSGENPLEPGTGDPAEFMSHPRWQRFVIALAGPFMNIIFAVALLTGVFMVHYEHPAYLDKPAVIGWVAENSPAQAAGLQAGDRIIRAEDLQDPTWEDIRFKMLLNPDQPVDLAVQRGSQILAMKITIPSDKQTRQPGDPGWDPQDPVTVKLVEPDMPAAKAGIQPGDQLVAVDGQAITTLPVLQTYLQKAQSKPVELTILRNGQQSKTTVTPVLRAAEGVEKPYYRLGFSAPPTMSITKLSFAGALGKSIELNRRFSGLIFELLQKLVQRKVSIKQFDGPIGIGRAAGQAAEQGPLQLILLTAMISLNLGIFNLLPIPIMDGGVILLLIIESIMRRDINARFKEIIYQAAFVFLILFAVVVIYNDIAKLPGLGKFLP